MANRLYSSIMVQALESQPLWQQHHGGVMRGGYFWTSSFDLTDVPAHAVSTDQSYCASRSWRGHACKWIGRCAQWFDASLDIRVFCHRRVTNVKSYDLGFTKLCLACTLLASLFWPNRHILHTYTQKCKIYKSIFRPNVVFYFYVESFAFARNAF